MKNETGMTVNVEDMGAENRTVIGWDTKKKYTKEQLKKQRDEFEKKAAEGHVINLSDLFSTHGM